MKKLKRIISLAAVLTMLFSVTVSSAAVSYADETETETDGPVVSVVNFSPVWGDKEANLEAMAEIIEEAAESGTDIIIFPEMALIGYTEGMEYLEGSDTVMPVELAESKTGESAAYLSDLAEEYGMYIIYGATETVEGDSEHAYNSAFVCTPDGCVDSYQAMLVDEENEWCIAGDTPVYVETEFGLIGLSVGEDTYDLIEVMRAYSADGCFMIASCTAIEAEVYTQTYSYSAAILCDYTEAYMYYDWTDYNRNRIANVVYMAGLYVASANLSGEYGGTVFEGGSAVVGLTESETYNQIWSLWSSHIADGTDLIDYIIKYYAGSADSTDEICIGRLDIDTVTHELVSGDDYGELYQTGLYAQWYSTLGTSAAESTVSSENPTVAVVNMTPVWADKDANVEKMTGYIEEAAAQGVDIIVFPEMALAGYAYTSDENSEEWSGVVANAESIDGKYAAIIAEYAEKYDMYVIYGTSEVNPDDEWHPYNSAFVATPDGETVSYRKVHVVEGDWATWGTDPLIVETPWGSMGISICMDTYAYPELARYYAAAGCTILINPTASSSYAGSNFIYNTAISSIAARDGMALLSSDLVNTSGCGDGSYYPGKSTILTTNGISPIYLTEESMTEETMYVAELDLSETGFDLSGYNPETITAIFENLAAGIAIYDFSGLTAAADYVYESEADAGTEETAADGSEDSAGEEDAEAAGSTADDSSEDGEGADASAEAAEVGDSFNAAFWLRISIIAALACGGCALRFIRKKKES